MERKVYPLPMKTADVAVETEVLIVGGGPAGCAAALAAARNGARTVLLEGTMSLGGMSTNGMVPTWCPFSDREKIIYRGIAEEIFTASREALEFETESLYDWVPIDPEALKRIYDEKLHEAGVEVRFGTFVCAADVSDGRIRALFAADKAGLHAYVSSVYIDCTGDGDAAFYAGAKCVEGDGNGHVQAASLCFALSGVKEEHYRRHSLHGSQPESPVHAACADEAFPDISDSHLCSAPVKKGTVGFNAGHLWDVHTSDVKGLSDAMRDGRRKAYEYLCALKKYDAAAFGEASLAETASLCGIRESRRVRGDYVLTAEDYLARRSFPDEIGRNCYYLDIHMTAAERQATGITPSRYAKGESHGIPYRCLVPQGLKNLLTAGRCISTDRAVNGSTRVMPVCLVTGEAAGTAAAMAVKKEDIDLHSLDVVALRRTLKENGCYFL